MRKSLLISVLCAAALFCGCCGEKAAAPSADQLTIVAQLTALPEDQAELLEAINACVDATRQEPGNISYNVYEDVSDPLKLTFIETWKSQEAIDAHMSSAHFQAFAAVAEGKAALSVSVLRHKL
jgi:quinol monooxygenase YgiN